jgi:TolB-like protein/Flp pilus assembly protein TadD
MGGPSVRTAPSEKRLESWKEIAGFLNRDVTTVQRWEKREGMPVHRHLHNSRGSVYALSSELDVWFEGRRQRLNRESEVVAPEVPAITEGLDRVRSERKSGLRLALAVTVVIVLCGSAWLAYRMYSGRSGRPVIRSLAVLPMRNLSGDPGQDYLADGMTEALIGQLSEIHNLRVISHTSTQGFKNSQLSVPEIARTLGVDAVVEGSVTREGDRMRVTAQLIRGATDEHFWSQTYDREMKDALTLQSELAQSIAEKVEATVTGEERERLNAARAVAPEVYESYLKGTFALDHGNTKAEIEQSIAHFEDALRKDSTFAPAYLGLAQANTRLGTVFGGVSPAETRPKVISYARKALEFDPSLVEAHVVLANVLQEEWQWAEAETEYRRALQLNPNAAGAHGGFALWLLCEGRTQEAIAEVKHARELDPVGVPGGTAAWILFQARHFDESIREYRSALAVEPDEAGTLSGLGFALVANNQPEEAIPVLEKSISLSKGSPASVGVLIRAYAQTGRRNDALRLLEELKKRRDAGYIPAASFVNGYLGLDDKEQAFYWLEKSYKEKSNILQFLKTHPYFDPIRDDPRFSDLVRRVGLG